MMRKKEIEEKKHFFAKDFIAFFHFLRNKNKLKMEIRTFWKNSVFSTPRLRKISTNTETLDDVQLEEPRKAQ